MPFCKVSLKSSKPLPPSYPREVKTIGDHIRRRRLDLKLNLTEAAAVMGVCSESVTRWENNREQPAARTVPKIIKFLGRTPYSDISTMNLGEQISICRRIHGLSKEKLAERLRINPTTVARWEKGRNRPTLCRLKELREIFGLAISNTVAIGEEVQQ